jgi:hypothetical protein
MTTTFYAAKHKQGMLHIRIERGHKEIKIGLSDGELKVWHDVELDADQAEGLRKFLEENHWS